MIVPPFGKNDDGDDPKGNINRFDWGIAIQGSIYWKRLFLNVAYQKGLKSANITDEKNEGKDKLALSNFVVRVRLYILICEQTAGTVGK